MSQAQNEGNLCFCCVSFTITEGSPSQCSAALLLKPILKPARIFFFTPIGSIWPSFNPLTIYHCLSYAGSVEPIKALGEKKGARGADCQFITSTCRTLTQREPRRFMKSMQSAHREAPAGNQTSGFLAVKPQHCCIINELCAFNCELVKHFVTAVLKTVI